MFFLIRLSFFFLFFFFSFFFFLCSFFLFSFFLFSLFPFFPLSVFPSFLLSFFPSFVFFCSSYECASSGDVIIQDCLLSSEEIKNFQCINSSDASQLWCVRSQTDSGKARMFWDFSIVFFVLSLFGCAYYFGLRCINFFSEK